MADALTTNGKAWPLQPAGRIALLDVDPDLAGPASDANRSALREKLTAPVYRLSTGSMPLPRDPVGHGHLGYLLLKGLLLYEVSACGRTTAELLGPGDLVRPWARAGSATLPITVSWTILEPALLADLGPAARSHASEEPGVTEALIMRCADRAESVAIQRSITAHVRVDVRVLAYLWHLADRFGVVLPGAVKLDVPLTHAVLARLVGARRPTVTTALQRLIHLDYLRRDGRAFILIGDGSAVAELESRSPSRDFALPTAVGEPEAALAG